VPSRVIITDTDECELVETWRVDPDTIHRLWLSAQDFLMETGRPVWIISGWRSRAQQRSLGRSGRPTARDDRSTHRSCPATGVDISFGLSPTGFIKATWGRITLTHGLRWGGGGKTDEAGIPLDWAHVDLGPRR